LSEALDKLAAQAGAMNSVFHAVYKNSRSLKKLEFALKRGDTKCGGWTNLSLAATGLSGGNLDEIQRSLLNGSPGGTTPTSKTTTKSFVISGVNGTNVSGLENLPPELRQQVQQQIQQMATARSSDATAADAPSGTANTVVITNASDIGKIALGGRNQNLSPEIQQQIQQQLKQIMGSQSGSNHGNIQIRVNTKPIIINAQPNGEIGTSLADGSPTPTIIHARPRVILARGTRDHGVDDIDEAVELLPPACLLMEEPLPSELGNDPSFAATDANAVAIARKTRAHTKTLYVLKASPAGNITPLVSKLMNGVRGAGSISNGIPADFLDDINHEVQKEKMANYLDGTPEERAKKAQIHNPNSPATR
jgi:hypothetical protein